ncbi:ArsR/SmtB family transcription factor [Novacetimonas pomaceti]|uniref:Transcriptional regulator n=1 Tax=Novacetimonas pomaceti TaxID=2021998 RepID=A0A318QBL3_9PROT|nr:metalloregulator ArsR/SmtB family transcription factor [Novacetimonas pomaceti]MBV1832980.1 metalloregulator ArsR/SmtB family transcription factor [Novacetimonas pomaceti]PYD47808.1 transcriptional regulator [Novacetimonas pomaceti]PYD77107.1 transcriptional regulator [Novacetimonas pomaceti]
MNAIVENLPRTRGAAELLAQRLRLFAQPQRLLVLATLLEGEKSVGQIESATNIGQPTLSQQLAELRRAEIVVTRKEARQVIYRIITDEEAMRIRFMFSIMDPSVDIHEIVARVGEGAIEEVNTDVSRPSVVSAARFVRIASPE